MGIAAPAFAANGVQPGTQNFGNTEGASDNASINLTYDTAGGKWHDPGADPDSPDDNGTNENGTYKVTIPTAITYSDMAIGTVNTDDNYTVNVRGAIPSGQSVTLTAETGNTLKNGEKADITETTTQGKTVWSADECFGTLNSDGSISGTDSTDNIKMSGTAKVAGSYTGAVKYTATLG